MIEKKLTPSTISVSPVTNWLAPLARNTAGPIKSSGAPHRPPGVPLRRLLTNSGFCLAASFLRRQRGRKDTHQADMSVAILPGAIELTRILCLAHSLLIALVRPATAALDAV